MGYKLVSDNSNHFSMFNDYKYYIIILLIVLIFMISFKDIILLDKIRIGGKVYKNNINEHFLDKLELETNK